LDKGKIQPNPIRNWLTTGSTQVLGGSGQKLTRTEICKKFQPNSTQNHGGSGCPTNFDPF